MAKFYFLKIMLMNGKKLKELVNGVQLNGCIAAFVLGNLGSNSDWSAVSNSNGKLSFLE